MAHEEEKEVELAHRELDRVTPDRDGTGSRIDLQIVEGDRGLALWLGIASAQHGIDSRDELGG